jgi:cyclic pyranopterin phosphate synthase
MPLIRHGEDPQALADRISGVWAERGDRYSELRGAQGRKRPKIEMYRLGG